MNKKKVVLVILEGPSDEAAVGSVLKEHFCNDTVQFLVTHGDITTDYSANVDNVLSKIGNNIKINMERYYYKKEDCLQVIHLVDLDGAFIDEDAVYEKDVAHFMYYSDHIEATSKINAINRNARKAAILKKLYSTNKILKIPYRVYYFSCNLEHVLYNRLEDFSDEEKEEMADAFAEKYEGKINDFINFISDKNFAVSGSFKETWEFVQKDKNSLNRFCNIHKIFESNLLP